MGILNVNMNKIVVPSSFCYIYIPYSVASSPARAKNGSAWYTQFAHAFKSPQDVGTPGNFLILPCHVTSEFGLDIVNLSG